MPAVHRYGSARRLYIMPQTAGSLIPGHPVTTLKEYCLIGLLFLWGNSPMAPVYEKTLHPGGNRVWTGIMGASRIELLTPAV